MTTTLVTNPGATSYWSARIVVTTAAGIEAWITAAWNAAPCISSSVANSQPSAGVTSRESATAVATADTRIWADDSLQLHPEHQNHQRQRCIAEQGDRPEHGFGSGR